MYHSSHTESDLLQALARGDRKATEQIYKQNYPVVSGWLAKNGGSDDDAADLFQEAMVVLFSKAQSHDFTLSCSIGTYLFSVSKNLWYKKLQQMQRTSVKLFDNMDGDGDETSPFSFSDDVAVHHEREAHFEQLDQALELLGEPCRSILHEYYHKDKSMQEIAAAFGYTNPDNAKTQKYKCLTRLRKLFQGMQAK